MNYKKELSDRLGSVDYIPPCEFNGENYEGYFRAFMTEKQLMIECKKDHNICPFMECCGYEIGDTEEEAMKNLLDFFDSE